VSDKLATRNKAKKRDRAAQRASFLERIANIPRPANFAYTDGSALGNPGPGGAGVTFLLGRGPRKFSSKYLGPLVTNNVAELKALGMCAEDIYADLVATHPLSPHVPLYICIDNSYTINVADGKWKPKTNRKTIKETKTWVDKLRQVTPTFLIWVPGHAKIDGNDIADQLAKRGARGNTSRAPPDASLVLPPPPERILRQPQEDKSSIPPTLPANQPPPMQLPDQPHEDVGGDLRRSARIAGRPKEVSLAPPGIDFSLQKQANRGRTQAHAHARHQHDQKSSPKCKHGVTNGNNLESSKWREGMKCPKCWKEYTADHGRPPDPEQDAAKQKRLPKNKTRNPRTHFTPTRGLSRFGTSATLPKRSSMSNHDEKKKPS